jgi:putative oxidoreductase
MAYASTSPTSHSSAQTSQADLAALLLRVAMGVLFVLHAWMKISVFTPAGTAQYFASIGLPGVLAYLTIAAELLGGLALIAGVFTRWVSLALVPVMVGAAFFGHGSAGFFFSNAGGGWEYPAFWTVALLVQALLGDGAYSLTNRAAR